MAFATTNDVSDRLGRDLSEGEAQSVTYLLAAATNVIAAAGELTDEQAVALDPVPNIVQTITVELVVRAIANPNALHSFQEQLGAYSTTAVFRDLDLLLTRNERKVIRKAFSLSSFQALTLETPYSGDTDDDWPELPLS